MTNAHLCLTLPQITSQRGRGSRDFHLSQVLMHRRGGDVQGVQIRHGTAQTPRSHPPRKQGIVMLSQIMMVAIPSSTTMSVSMPVMTMKVLPLLQIMMTALLGLAHGRLVTSKSGSQGLLLLLLFCGQKNAPNLARLPPSAFQQRVQLEGR